MIELHRKHGIEFLKIMVDSQILTSSSLKQNVLHLYEADEITPRLGNAMTCLPILYVCIHSNTIDQVNP